jgi:hypothetical protein
LLSWGRGAGLALRAAGSREEGARRTEKGAKDEEEIEVLR